MTSVPFVTEMLQGIAGDRASVEGLLPGGQNDTPYWVRPSAEQLKRLDTADLIVYVAEHLESKSLDVFTDAKRRGKNVVCLLDEIPESRVLRLPYSPEERDPHIWHDADLWSQCALIMAEKLASIRPADATFFRRRGKELADKYQSVHQWAIAKANELPRTRRHLVTDLWCMQYFARAYDFDLTFLGILRTSPRENPQLVKNVQDLGLKAVFDRKYGGGPPGPLEWIFRNSGIKVETRFVCYSPREDEGDAPGRLSYPDLIKHNMTIVVEGLR